MTEKRNMIAYIDGVEASEALGDFLAMLTSELDSDGYDLVIRDTSEIPMDTPGMLQSDISAYSPALVMNATGKPDVSRACLDIGIPCFNDPRMMPLKNDKLRAFPVAWSLGIPAVATERLTDAVACLNGGIGFPCIVKRRLGHGGEGVRLVSDAKEFKQTLCDIAMIGADPADYVVQEPAVHPECEKRVFIVGNEVVGAIVKVMSTDLPSGTIYEASYQNISVDEIAPQVIEACRKLIDFVDIGFSGIDFLLMDDCWALNEIHGASTSPMSCEHMSGIARELSEYMRRLAEDKLS